MKQYLVLDATMLSTLMACPRLADFRFNQNLVLKEGKSNSLEVGSLVHIVLEFFNKSLIAGKNRQDAIEIGFIAGHEFLRGQYDVTNSYLRAQDDYASEKFIAQEESDKYNLGWKYVFATLNEYFDYWRNDSFSIVAAEHVDTKTIYSDDEMEIGWKAKFDLIIDMNTGMMPVDHKTMKQRRDANSNNIQFMGQCFLTGARCMMINRIGFQSSLKAHEKFERVIVNYTADRLDEFANEIVPYYARMLLAYNEANNYPPNFTHCENKFGACDFYRHDVCNSDRRMREETLKIYFKIGKPWDPQNEKKND